MWNFISDVWVRSQSVASCEYQHFDVCLSVLKSAWDSAILTGRIVMKFPAAIFTNIAQKFRFKNKKDPSHADLHTYMSVVFVTETTISVRYDLRLKKEMI